MKHASAFEEQLRPQTNPPRPNPRELKAGWRLIRDDSRGPQATSRIRVRIHNSALLGDFPMPAFPV